MSYFVLDENKNLKEALDKEGVYAALQQAIADGSLERIDSDSAFVSKFKCCVGGGTFRLAVITQAQFNNLAATGRIEEDVIYHITDDNTLDEIAKRMEMIDGISAEVENIKSGATVVGKAKDTQTVNGVMVEKKNDYIFIDDRSVDSKSVIRLGEDKIIPGNTFSFEIPMKEIKPMWLEIVGGWESSGYMRQRVNLGKALGSLMGAILYDGATFEENSWYGWEYTRRSVYISIYKSSDAGGTPNTATIYIAPKITKYDFDKKTITSLDNAKFILKAVYLLHADD